MEKIKIRTRTKAPEDKEKLLQILGVHHALATNICEARDGCAVTIFLQEELDAVFDPNYNDVLRSKSFMVVMPPDLKERRTILMFNCPEENSTQPTFTENMIEEAYRFPSKPILRITFKQTTVAKKINVDRSPPL